jgi:hypothetical protein
MKEQKEIDDRERRNIRRKRKTEKYKNRQLKKLL